MIHHVSVFVLDFPFPIIVLIVAVLNWHRSPPFRSNPTVSLFTILSFFLSLNSTSCSTASLRRDRFDHSFRVGLGFVSLNVCLIWLVSIMHIFSRRWAA